MPPEIVEKVEIIRKLRGRSLAEHLNASQSLWTPQKGSTLLKPPF